MCVCLQISGTGENLGRERENYILVCLFAGPVRGSGAVAQ